MESRAELAKRDGEGQLCVLCRRRKGETPCVIRRAEGARGAPPARSPRSVICSGCILRFAYLGRIWRDLRLTVVNPAPDVFVEIVKNGMLVTVATETLGGTLLDPAHRDRLALALAKDDEEFLQDLHFRYLAVVVSRLPRSEHIVELLKRHGLVPPGWSLAIAPSAIAFATVDDDGLAELGRVIQEKMRANLDRAAASSGPAA